MENPSPRGAQERENPSPTNSPSSNGSTSMSSSCSSSTNNGCCGAQIQPTPPLTPRPMNPPATRSEPNTPYPTTFVQADTSTFKQVVQMLTGSAESGKQAPNPRPGCPDPGSSKSCIPPVRTGQQKKQGFKLYERRNSLKNGLMISPLISAAFAHHHHNNPSGFSPRKPSAAPEILSPSMLDFPKLVLSPVTPLNQEDPIFSRASSFSPSPEQQQEAKVIAEKGFYLHPSPMTTPRDGEPQLLPLFPVTSPRVSGSSS